MVGGPALICAALAALALPVSVPVAVALSVLTGVGTATFTTHIAPTLLRMAPPDQLTRFQSLMAIVQLAPPALLNSPLAALSGTGRGSMALIITAGMAGFAAVAAAHGLRQQKSAATPEERTAAPA